MQDFTRGHVIVVPGIGDKLRGKTKDIWKSVEYKELALSLVKQGERGGGGGFLSYTSYGTVFIVFTYFICK